MKKLSPIVVICVIDQPFQTRNIMINDVNIWKKTLDIYTGKKCSEYDVFPICGMIRQTKTNHWNEQIKLVQDLNDFNFLLSGIKYVQTVYVATIMKLMTWLCDEW